MKFKFFHNPKFIKVLVITLRLLFVALALYLICLPFYPEVKYNFSTLEEATSQDLEAVTEQVENIKRELPESEYTVSPDRLIIPKIGVNAPVILTDNEHYGLSLGAWMVPKGSTPDKGGNTVITGHRFKYLPPSNLTFYLFHKLEIGDVFSVLWKGNDYYYRVKEIKVVDPSDASPYDKSATPILTMYTCHPIYSTEKRLVIISDLVAGEENLADVLTGYEWLENEIESEMENEIENEMESEMENEIKGSELNTTYIEPNTFIEPSTSTEPSTPAEPDTSTETIE